MIVRPLAPDRCVARAGCYCYSRILARNFEARCVVLKGARGEAEKPGTKAWSGIGGNGVVFVDARSSIPAMIETDRNR